MNPLSSQSETLSQRKCRSFSNEDQLVSQRHIVNDFPISGYLEGLSSKLSVLPRIQRQSVILVRDVIPTLPGREQLPRSKLAESVFRFLGARDGFMLTHQMLVSNVRPIGAFR